MPKTHDNNYVMHPVMTGKETPIPATGMFLVNPSDLELFRINVCDKEWERRPLFNSNLYVHKDKGLFVAGPSIGAPMAVLTFEKLIALGADNIILFGWGGGLRETDQIGDIVLPEQCVSGEGTSAYYVREKMLPVSARGLEKLEEILNGREFRFRRGTGWSTDAPYREEKSCLEQLKKDNCVDIIDMEVSALNSVATFRGIEFAAVLVVSDLPLSENWRMGSKDKGFRNTVRDLIQLLCSNCI